MTYGSYDPPRDPAERGEVQKLIDRVSRPGMVLHELIGEILQAAALQTNCADCEATVDGIGSFTVELRQGETRCEHVLVQGARRRALSALRTRSAPRLVADSEAPRGRPGATSEVNPRAETAPLIFARRRLGALHWHAGTAELDSGELAGFFSRLARELAVLVQRFEICSRAPLELNEELLLTGTSSALRRLERSIERCSQVDLPVLLEGPFGSQKLQVAFAMHACSERRDASFVEVRCEPQMSQELDRDLQSWFESAGGGTIFFNDIDKLGVAAQSRLPRFITSVMGQWLSPEDLPSRPDVRVIASTSEDLRAKVEQGEFSQSLLAELSLLRVQLPTLRDRKADIRPIVERLLRKHETTRRRLVSEPCFRALEEYKWPENVFEIERAVARVLALSDRDVIEPEVLRDIAPGVVASAPIPIVEANQDPPGNEAEVASDAPTTSSALVVEELIKKVAFGEYSFAENFHPSLRRALQYIGERSEDPLSLPELAKASCVSCSHLSYLFRTTLGTTFKPFLAMVRIERAKQMLVEKADERITDVSLDVGFGDLSHFEKMFKRFVKLNPREYRRRRLEELARGNGARRSPIAG